MSKICLRLLLVICGQVFYFDENVFGEQVRLQDQVYTDLKKVNTAVDRGENKDPFVYHNKAKPFAASASQAMQNAFSCLPNQYFRMVTSGCSPITAQSLSSGSYAKIVESLSCLRGNMNRLEIKSDSADSKQVSDELFYIKQQLDITVGSVNQWAGIMQSCSLSKQNKNSLGAGQLADCASQDQSGFSSFLKSLQTKYNGCQALYAKSHGGKNGHGSSGEQGKQVKSEQGKKSESKVVKVGVPAQNPGHKPEHKPEHKAQTAQNSEAQSGSQKSKAQSGSQNSEAQSGSQNASKQGKDKTTTADRSVIGVEGGAKKNAFILRQCGEIKDLGERLSCENFNKTVLEAQKAIVEHDQSKKQGISVSRGSFNPYKSGVGLGQETEVKDPAFTKAGAKVELDQTRSLGSGKWVFPGVGLSPLEIKYTLPEPVVLRALNESLNFLFPPEKSKCDSMKKENLRIGNQASCGVSTEPVLDPNDMKWVGQLVEKKSEKDLRVAATKKILEDQVQAYLKRVAHAQNVHSPEVFKRIKNKLLIACRPPEDFKHYQFEKSIVDALEDARAKEAIDPFSGKKREMTDAEYANDKKEYNQGMFKALANIKVIEEKMEVLRADFNHEPEELQSIFPPWAPCQGLIKSIDAIRSATAQLDRSRKCNSVQDIADWGASRSSKGNGLDPASCTENTSAQYKRSAADALIENWIDEQETVVEVEEKNPAYLEWEKKNPKASINEKNKAKKEFMHAVVENVKKGNKKQIAEEIPEEFISHYNKKITQTKTNYLDLPKVCSADGRCRVRPICLSEACGVKRALLAKLAQDKLALFSQYPKLVERVDAQGNPDAAKGKMLYEHFLEKGLKENPEEFLAKTGTDESQSLDQMIDSIGQACQYPESTGVSLLADQSSREKLLGCEQMKEMPVTSSYERDRKARCMLILESKDQVCRMDEKQKTQPAIEVSDHGGAAGSNSLASTKQKELNQAVVGLYGEITDAHGCLNILQSGAEIGGALKNVFKTSMKSAPRIATQIAKTTGKEFLKGLFSVENAVTTTAMMGGDFQRHGWGGGFSETKFNQGNCLAGILGTDECKQIMSESASVSDGLKHAAIDAIKGGIFFSTLHGVGSAHHEVTAVLNKNSEHLEHLEKKRLSEQDPVKRKKLDAEIAKQKKIVSELAAATLAARYEHPVEKVKSLFGQEGMIEFAKHELAEKRAQEAHEALAKLSEKSKFEKTKEMAKKVLEKMGLSSKGKSDQEIISEAHQELLKNNHDALAVAKLSESIHETNPAELAKTFREGKEALGRMKERGEITAQEHKKANQFIDSNVEKVLKASSDYGLKERFFSDPESNFKRFEEKMNQAQSAKNLVEETRRIENGEYPLNGASASSPYRENARPQEQSQPRSREAFEPAADLESRTKVSEFTPSINQRQPKEFLQSKEAQSSKEVQSSKEIQSSKETQPSKEIQPSKANSAPATEGLLSRAVSSIGSALKEVFRKAPSEKAPFEKEVPHSTEHVDKLTQDLSGHFQQVERFKNDHLVRLAKEAGFSPSEQKRLIEGLKKSKEKLSVEKLEELLKSTKGCSL